MEKRAILAAALMAGLLIVYQYLFSPPPDTRPKPAPQATETVPAAAPPKPIAPTPTPAASVPALPAKEPPPAPDRTAVIETPLYRAVVRSQGGALEAWELSYRGQKAMVLPGVVMSSGLTVTRAGALPRPVIFALSTDALKLGPGAPQGELRLMGDDGFGLRIVQTLRFRADSYVVEQEIRVENRHTVAQSAELALTWTAPVEWPKEQESFRGPRPIHVVRLKEGAFWPRREYLSKAELYVGEGRWVGFESGVAPTGQNGVYLTALIPKSPGIQVTEAPVLEGNGAKDKAPKAAAIGLRANPVLEPGKSWEGRAQAYLGPMEYDRLKALGVGLDKAIYFGGFPFAESWAVRWGVPTLPMEWVVVPLLAFMRWLYRFLPNYGLVIIVLTILTKVVFFPLTIKSMRSMRAMQALQPRVNALRAKYKNDSQRAQREMMELYRQHGVNPLGGCLPLVVQMPVFIALYVALGVSTEIQNAPFLCFGTAPSWVPWLGGQGLWICDLAAHDPTYILPLLMGASMFIQQKMTPTVGDPTQAKMMQFMPIMFTFFFLQMSSGLVLYWTLSNVLQIAQQKYMERDGHRVEAAARAQKKA
ncbi:MAG TPA: membrane protein insertase YidC [Methylomirabilota bacterium]|nr:membrane protein insertase YidC [Methylomirabilota bacterium]